MGGGSGLILLDPYPRTLEQIFTGETRTRLEALGDVEWHDGPRVADADVDAALADVVAIVGQTDLPRSRLDRAPKLRAVLNVEGNFLPNVDYDECFRRGIYVLVISPVFGQAVAEMALGLALAAARDIPRGDAEVRAGTEVLLDEGRNAGSFLLAGKTLGLVGCGNLGRALLPHLRPFGGEILVHDPWLQDAVVRELGAAPVALDELFARSRVVFILSAVTTENQGLLGEREFGAMQPGGVVVLASRAAVVDWDALLSAAESGRIKVATDVFPAEPIPADERARSAPNTVLSAHRAGNIPEIWPIVGEMVVDDLAWILRGLPPQRMTRAQPETVARFRSRPVG
ncbi:MAG TPA: NAD(P)-dependent oxidoreductase [Gaiellaceae bacterium]|nr:NAD(P)-dependent oxidoreductase [Gaiellaceae bacterium]